MSNVNPNFPIPGVDQSSRGFRDNFSIIKTELDNLQNTQIQIVGQVTSNVVTIGSDGVTVVLETSLNGALVGNTYVIDGNAITISGNASVTIDSWLTTQFRTAKYIAQVTDNANGTIQSSEFIVIHDAPIATHIATNSYKTEYAVVQTAMLGTFGTNVQSGGTQIAITFNPATSTSKTIKLTRTTIDI